MESSAARKIEQQVEDWPSADLRELAARLIDLAEHKTKSVQLADPARFVGSVNLTVDPVEFQRAIRAEWS